MKKVHEAVIQQLRDSQQQLGREMRSEITRIAELRRSRDEKAVAILEIDDLIALIKGDTGSD
jgi:hypothetical protein